MMLPRLMRQAISAQVLTEAEALEIHQLCLASKQDEVEMPPHLYQTVARLHLWEMPAPRWVM